MEREEVTGILEPWKEPQDPGLGGVRRKFQGGVSKLLFFVEDNLGWVNIEEKSFALCNKYFDKVLGEAAILEGVKRVTSKKVVSSSISYTLRKSN